MMDQPEQVTPHSPGEAWLVPIRYWEPCEPERITVLNDTSTTPDSWCVYAYSDAFGHNVYLRHADLFPSREAAVAEIARRTEERAWRNEQEFERWWAVNAEELFGIR